MRHNPSIKQASGLASDFLTGAVYSVVMTGQTPAFDTLEQAAFKLEDADALAAYEMAVLARFWPELSHHGAPRTLVLPNDRVKAKQVQAAILAVTPDSLPAKRQRAFVFADAAVKRFKDPATAYESGLTRSASDDAGKKYFALVTFGRNHCAHCRDSTARVDCAEVATPAEGRFEALQRFRTVEHEVAHAVSRLTGVYDRRAVLSRSEAWQDYADENLADAYASLRLISKFGAEGVTYLKRAVVQRIQVINAQETRDPEKAQIYLDHWTVGTLQHIPDRYGKNPAELKDKTPRELFALAQSEMRPLSPAAYAEVSQTSLGTHSAKTPDSRLEHAFNQMAQQKGLLPEIRDFLDYQVGAKGSGLTAALNGLSAQVGQMAGVPPSVALHAASGLYLPQKDRDWLAMATYDAEKTKGVCKVPYVLRLLETTQDPRLAAHAQIALPPRFAPP